MDFPIGRTFSEVVGDPSRLRALHRPLRNVYNSHSYPTHYLFFYFISQSVKAVLHRKNMEKVKWRAL